MLKRDEEFKEKMLILFIIIFSFIIFCAIVLVVRNNMCAVNYVNGCM